MTVDAKALTGSMQLDNNVLENFLGRSILSEAFLLEALPEHV